MKRCSLGRTQTGGTNVFSHAVKARCKHTPQKSTAPGDMHERKSPAASPSNRDLYADAMPLENLQARG